MLSFDHWLLILGCILLTLGLTSAYLRLLPITSSLLYLAFGLAIGPALFGLWDADLARASPWLEHLAETTLLVSLFIGGLKMRQSLRSPAWTAAWQLAGPVLLGCIAASAALAHYALGLSWGHALLVAAILSPTDPVLASIVQVGDAADDDRLRYAVSGEAGLNDGIAFPFVALGVLLIGDQASGNPALGNGLPGWVLVNFVWAIPAGLLLGYYLGYGTGRLAIHLRARHTDTSVLANDFLALALIALSYVGAESIGAWGFLACFAAGVGLRRAEVAIIGHDDTPADVGQGRDALEFGEDRSMHKRVAAGVVMLDILSFGDLLERSLALLLVTLLGALVGSHWDWRALLLGGVLFCLLRPAMVALLVTRRGLERGQRWLLGWFGIRGIGSLYYLCHVLNQTPHNAALGEVADLVLSVVALSICAHGLSTQPLLDRYERSRRPAAGGV